MHVSRSPITYIWSFNTFIARCHSVLASFCKLSNYVATRKQSSTCYFSPEVYLLFDQSNTTNPIQSSKPTDSYLDWRKSGDNQG
jgi:hypothetical protein